MRKSPGQLFVTDAPGPSTFPSAGQASDEELLDNGEDNDEEAVAFASDYDDDEDEDEDEAEGSTSIAALQKRKGSARAPVWNDPADLQLSVSLADTKRLRKLRSDAKEDVISGQEYEMKLRQQ